MKERKTESRAVDASGDVVDAIRRSEERITALCEELNRAEAQLAQLRSRLTEAPPTATATASDSAVTNAAPTTAASKITLFRSLFLGRCDIFPRLWINRKKGTKGYAPACHNEWMSGVCRKPKIKCGECPNQAFVPVTDKVLHGHLTGRHVMGVYPLLHDETCWFLAVDFDKQGWMDDVAAFRATCDNAGISIAVEKSRSGNGAHAWFFFSAPVSAATARKMGCFLITETMANRYELSMASYDRLFPNQDTMPRGGFGNLIALPLQYEARQSGNTLFVDDTFAPYSDQWGYLASLARITPERVEAIAQEASQKGQVVGVRMTETADGEDDRATPWLRRPSGKTKLGPITIPLPETVECVQSQRLFVSKAGLPATLLNQVKRLAAFQNPEFYKKQSMRLSTALTPRVIACAEDFPEHVALPRGCHDDLVGLLSEVGVALSNQDQRSTGHEIAVTFHGQLTDVQKRAVDQILKEDLGVFVAPPGVGKTVVGTYLVAARRRNTLILVHRSPLMDQWRAQLAMFLGLDAKEIGQIGGGKRKITGAIDVAMIQSLARKGNVDDLVADYGHVIVDECHHIPAVSFERILSEAKARYVTGLTATPKRRDGHHPIIQMQIGPVRFSVDPKSQAAKRPFEHDLIVRETSFRLPAESPNPTFQDLYQAIVSNRRRNELILNDVIAALEARRSPILLTERKDHLDYFASKLERVAKHLIVLKGGMTAKKRRDVAERLAQIPDGEERLLLATGRYIGEGFDDARLDTLFLAMPVSWKGTLIQYTGRLHRLHPGKTEVQIYDYVDREVPMLFRMFEKRLRGYRAIGYARGESLLGLDAPVEEPVIEWDQQALKSADGLPF